MPRRRTIDTRPASTDGSGIRLRYEIRREFAPYIDVSWLRSCGETGNWPEENEAYSQVAFVAGLPALMVIDRRIFELLEIAKEANGGADFVC